MNAITTRTRARNLSSKIEGDITNQDTASTTDTRMVKCSICLEDFEPTRSWQNYCGELCRTIHNNVASKIGLRVIEEKGKWRDRYLNAIEKHRPEIIKEKNASLKQLVRSKEFKAVVHETREAASDTTLPTKLEPRLLKEAKPSTVAEITEKIPKVKEETKAEKDREKNKDREKTKEERKMQVTYREIENVELTEDDINFLSDIYKPWADGIESKSGRPVVIRQDEDGTETQDLIPTYSELITIQAGDPEKYKSESEYKGKIEEIRDMFKNRINPKTGKGDYVSNDQFIAETPAAFYERGAKCRERFGSGS